MRKVRVIEGFGNPTTHKTCPNGLQVPKAGNRKYYQPRQDLHSAPFRLERPFG